MGLFSKLFGNNNDENIADKRSISPGGQSGQSNMVNRGSQKTNGIDESTFDFYSNTDPILHIKYLKAVFPIYHRLNDGRWPFLATNGVAKVFSFQDTAEEYNQKTERSTFVKGMSQSEFTDALHSWYRDGITKILLDGENGSELLISDILNDPLYPNKVYLGSELNRQIIICEQLDADDQGFLTNIMYSGLQSDLPKNVFLTHINSQNSDNSILPCTDMADELISEMGGLTFWGTESYTISTEVAPKLEDIQLFDIDDEGNKVISLFTNMYDFRRFYGKNVNAGVVAYGDAMYRLTSNDFTDKAVGIVINPTGVMHCIFK